MRPMAETRPPVPPPALAQRVGAINAADAVRRHDELGRRQRDAIVAALPAGWSFDGRRVLDFGCGAGRTLRHFLAEAATAEIWGCDIDAASVEWLQGVLCPPLHVLQNDAAPPLPFDDGSFDLIYALSVFTHITDRWSEWLLELHRVLAPDGLLLTTFLGPGMCEHVSGEPFADERIGMNVTGRGRSWDDGGPTVLHSPWWIRAHWGRLFDIVVLEPQGFSVPPGDPTPSHGYVVLRKRPVHVHTADLEAPEPGEEREVSSARHNIVQLDREIEGLRADLERIRRSPPVRLGRWLRALLRRARATAS
jgi:SAM-dependent methyltransferase